MSRASGPTPAAWRSASIRSSISPSRECCPARNRLFCAAQPPHDYHPGRRQSRRSDSSRSGTPVAQRDDRWSRPSREIRPILDGIPVRWVTVLRGSELGVLRGRQSRHIRHRSDMTKLAGVDHSADRLTTPSATSSSTTLTTRPLASYNTALGWPSTQASRIQAPRTRPRRSRPTSSRMTRYRRASGFPIACALPPPYQHRPLHRREGLQQHKERHGQRVGQLGARPAPGRRRARRPARAASPPRTSPAAPAPNSGS